MSSLLHKIISTGSGNRCYRITNADGKSWLLPARNMRVALNLYQPSGRNGKLLKALFPWLHRLPIVRKAIKAETISCTLQQELKELLLGIFNYADLEFAIFEGTPCVHQKITIQLSCGNKILGYCKASDNEEILQLFEKEAATLTQLAQKGVTNIPQALHCGTLSNGVHIFVQSTAKPQNRRWCTPGDRSKSSSLPRCTKKPNRHYHLRRATIAAPSPPYKSTLTGYPRPAGCCYNCNRRGYGRILRQDGGIFGLSRRLHPVEYVCGARRIVCVRF